MKNTWYGDNRDIVKWSTLISLSRSNKFGTILYVPYLRDSVFGNITIDNRKFDVRAEVVSHFRDVLKVKLLTENPSIEILADQFNNRLTYKSLILDFIQKNSDKKDYILFLDPDTGLEPANHPSLCHVLDNELREIWNKVPGGCVVACYQHKTNRNANPWIVGKQRQFAEAIGVNVGAVKIASGAIANDVAIFYAHKD
ncbi:hypothetical protein [Solidesulfovibrio sp.]